MKKAAQQTVGQSKQYRERFFAKHNYCCFCGGAERAVQIEHMPSRTMFKNKHRPRGFEFPICKSCNDVSRQSEPIVAFLAMAIHDPMPGGEFSSDLIKLMSQIKTYNPAFQDEMIKGGYGNRRKEKEIHSKTGLDIGLVTPGPVTAQHVALFGAKLGMATFYEHTGMPLSKHGGVSSAVHTPIDVAENKFPDFGGIFGRSETLKQGKWDVKSQFMYRWAITQAQDAAAFQYSFHNNLIITSFVFSNLNATKNSDLEWIRPGQLRKVDELELSPLSKYRSSISFSV